MHGIIFILFPLGLSSPLPLNKVEGGYYSVTTFAKGRLATLRRVFLESGIAMPGGFLESNRQGFGWDAAATWAMGEMVA